MKFFSSISSFIIFILFKCILSMKFLDKMSSLEVNGTETKFIIFDSSGFSQSEYIYFKFLLPKEFDISLGYQFEDIIDYNNPSQYESNLLLTTQPSSETFEAVNRDLFSVYYFGILKTKDTLKNKKGDYLILCFDIPMQIKIENVDNYGTMSQLAKGLATGVSIAIGLVVAFLLIITLIVIICCCCCRKKPQNVAMGYTNNVMMYNQMPMPMPIPMYNQQQQIPQGMRMIPDNSGRNLNNGLINGNNITGFQTNNNVMIPSTSPSPMNNNNKRISITKSKKNKKGKKVEKN